jgi:hypothetical protein
MQTFYLKFNDKASFTSLMEQTGFTYQNQEGITQFINASKNHALDIIGTIYNYNLDGTFTEVPGFHANLKIETLPGELQSYSLNVETPYRKFAGD